MFKLNNLFSGLIKRQFYHGKVELVQAILRQHEILKLDFPLENLGKDAYAIKCGAFREASTIH